MSGLVKGADTVIFDTMQREIKKLGNVAQIVTTGVRLLR